MECKARSGRGREQRRQDLIETSWNVKQIPVLRNSADEKDLIETSWNVKYVRKGYYIDQDSDLIETSWNVKALVMLMGFTQRT